MMSPKDFPEAELREGLRREIEADSRKTKKLKSTFEDDVVVKSATVVTIEELIKEKLGHDISSRGVLRSGGYSSVDEAVDEIVSKLRSAWQKKHK